MTLRDWVADTHSQFKRDPPGVAAKGAARAFYYGALRRAADVSGVTPTPTPIWGQGDWDICCILDGCRYDLFLQVAWSDTFEWLSEHPDSITSAGSMSAEFINNTFAPAYRDEIARTAYITGNPFTSKDLKQWPNLPLDESEFGLLDETWQTEWRDNYSEGDISTIPPGPLTDRAIDVWRRREELGLDRVIIHYMQPHAPFVSHPEHFGARRDLNEFGQPMPGGRTKSIWHKWRDGEVDGDTVWNGYRKNLEWVLEDVDRLRTNADATIALTSDHGNAIGEWGIWGHPGGIPFDCLREVPWTTVEGVDRQTVDPAPVSDGVSDVEAEEIERRLTALGYKS